jgi:hypothetical protein
VRRNERDFFSEISQYVHEMSSLFHYMSSICIEYVHFFRHNPFLCLFKFLFFIQFIFFSEELFIFYFSSFKFHRKKRVTIKDAFYNFFCDLIST